MAHPFFRNVDWDLVSHRNLYLQLSDVGVVLTCGRGGSMSHLFQPDRSETKQCFYWSQNDLVLFMT